jgi:protein SCO1/2
MRLFNYKFSKTAKRRAELRLLQLALALLLGLALAAGVVLWQVDRDEARRAEIKQQAQGTLAQPELPPGTKAVNGPWTLVDENGNTVTDATYKGKSLFVYFGYTYCPDMCPTGLQSIAHALDELGPEVKKVATLFITVDPARDTPAVLKQYTASFHPEITGLTGSAAQIAAVAKEYQVYYKRGEAVDEQDYMMDHSTLIYLMDPQGNLSATFPENADPKDLVKAVRAQWAKTGNRS